MATAELVFAVIGAACVLCSAWLALWFCLLELPIRERRPGYLSLSPQRSPGSAEPSSELGLMPLSASPLPSQPQAPTSSTAPTSGRGRPTLRLIRGSTRSGLYAIGGTPPESPTGSPTTAATGTRGRHTQPAGFPERCQTLGYAGSDRPELRCTLERGHPGCHDWQEI